VEKIVERFPERFMLCDEVGLGKTIDAGLAIRQLVISERVKRCLILVPKSIAKQWQEELYEKFVLNIPRYDGGAFYDVFGRQVTRLINGYRFAGFQEVTFDASEITSGIYFYRINAGDIIESGKLVLLK
ncbi:MAG: hypothetical protein JSU74_00470, partial [Candidatus Zixiibacteriota bacterium]